MQSLLSASVAVCRTDARRVTQRHLYVVMSILQRGRRFQPERARSDAPWRADLREPVNFKEAQGFLQLGRMEVGPCLHLKLNVPEFIWNRTETRPLRPGRVSTTMPAVGINSLQPAASVLKVG